MSVYDLINGVFELVGAIATWANYLRIRRDKAVRGVNPLSMAFFAAWGIWNLVFYPHLTQWASTAGAALLVTGNIAWLVVYLKYRTNSGN